MTISTHTDWAEVERRACEFERSRRQVSRLVAYWNTHGFSPQGKRERRYDARRMMRQNVRGTLNNGKGNKAWKRADALDRGAFHIGYGLYVQ